MTFDPWPALDDEREQLADLLDSLTPEQWDAETLCDGWRVREVAAHLTVAGTVTARQLVPGLLKYRFSFDTWMDRASRARSAAPASELAAQVRALVGVHHKPPVVKEIDPLCDTLVHQQDIRRPLGMLRTIPGERLLAVADHLVGNRIYKVGKRTAGVRLRMTDHDWSTGDGLAVEGPGEAVVMAMIGRGAALDDLTGDGLALLRERY